MKISIVILLIVGIGSVIANPLTKQLTNKEPNESEVKHNEEASLNVNEPEPNQIEPSEDFLSPPDAGEDIPKYGDGDIDIVIEENVTPLEVDLSDEQNDIKIDDNDDDYLSPGDRVVDNILANRIKHEIMETAAGFAPLPFLRKKHTQPLRRRFAIRRQFQRYPYAPYRRLPVYYPYYRFYRPSSLRFY